ncbi:hypothetical protein DMB66_45190 [Actinoplanes sp. ATCC 53533]|nr:hypothetical protein DMB66_45190 [Actinoplanes sp. ATCC 53533]
MDVCELHFKFEKIGQIVRLNLDRMLDGVSRQIPLQLLDVSCIQYSKRRRSTIAKYDFKFGLAMSENSGDIGNRMYAIIAKMYTIRGEVVQTILNRGGKRWMVQDHCPGLHVLFFPTIFFDSLYLVLPRLPLTC